MVYVHINDDNISGSCFRTSFQHSVLFLSSFFHRHLKHHDKLLSRNDLNEPCLFRLPRSLRTADWKYGGCDPCLPWSDSQMQDQSSGQPWRSSRESHTEMFLSKSGGWASGSFAHWTNQVHGFLGRVPSKFNADKRWNFTAENRWKQSCAHPNQPLNIKSEHWGGVKMHLNSLMNIDRKRRKQLL